jgi:recombination protein RecA
MPSAAHLRQQIEAALASRIPSALTPAPRVIRPTAPTGIPALDDALNGGLPIGSITELAGPECSGRTSLALSFVACLTRVGRVCAWIDVSDTLHPESAAAIGVDLNRLLWIRCGPEPQQLTLPGFGQNPPAESAKETSVTAPIAAPAKPSAIEQIFIPCCSEPVPKVRQHSREVVPGIPAVRRASDICPDRQSVTCNLSPATVVGRPLAVRKPWTRLDQALRATDLLLQAGGFSAIVLDMGSVAPEFALRVPLATWFRYRAAAERTHASVVLLTQHACTKSSAGLVLHCQPNSVDPGSTTVFTGTEHRVEIARERFAPAAKVVDFDRRKPPQSDHSILWQSHTPWSSEVRPDTRPIPHVKSGRK